MIQIHYIQNKPHCPRNLHHYQIHRNDQSYSKYYRPSHIGSPISTQAPKTNWSDSLLSEPAPASSELNPPLSSSGDEPPDPPAAHQEVTQRV